MNDSTPSGTAGALLSWGEAAFALHRRSLDQVARFARLAKQIDEAFKHAQDREQLRALGTCCVALHQVRGVIAGLSFEPSTTPTERLQLAGDDLDVVDLIDACCSKLERADELLSQIEEQLAFVAA